MFPTASLEKVKSLVALAVDVAHLLAPAFVFRIINSLPALHRQRVGDCVRHSGRHFRRRSPSASRFSSRPRLFAGVPGTGPPEYRRV